MRQRRNRLRTGSVSGFGSWIEPFMRAGLLVLVALLPATAQSDRGTVTGTVSDPVGAVVPNAPVSLKNVATGATYDTVTTATGNYTIPSLPVGRYSLTVAAAGFNQFIREGIDVQVAQTARIDVVLKVGAASESVTVTANAPLLRTENAVEPNEMSLNF